MAKYVMVVQSRAKEGRDADYNAWYDQIHFGDVSSLPGVSSGRRFDVSPVHIGEPGQPYLAIFEIETDDPSKIMAELGKRSASGEMKPTDAIDAEATVLWFYKQREIAAG